MSVVVVGLNHRSVPLDLLERMTIDDSRLPKALHDVSSREHISEAVVLSTGTDSPVIMDSSTALDPSSTTPSTGILSPGRTRSRSPGFTSSSGMSCSEVSSLSRRAIFGLRSSSARMALEVWLRAFNSSTCPSKTRVTIAALSTLTAR